MGPTDTGVPFGVTSMYLYMQVHVTSDELWDYTLAVSMTV